MPIKQVTSVLDDYDGGELPEDTTPTEVVLNGDRYVLYLSDANKEKLAEALGAFTKDAVPVTVPTFRPINGGIPGASITPDERKELQAWVANQGGKFKPVADRGRVAQATVDAWRAATKED